MGFYDEMLAVSQELLGTGEFGQSLTHVPITKTAENEDEPWDKTPTEGTPVALTGIIVDMTPGVRLKLGNTVEDGDRLAYIAPKAGTVIKIGDLLREIDPDGDGYETRDYTIVGIPDDLVPAQTRVLWTLLLRQ